jgi:hypothetical protein
VKSLGDFNGVVGAVGVVGVVGVAEDAEDAEDGKRVIFVSVVLKDVIITQIVGVLTMLQGEGQGDTVMVGDVGWREIGVFEGFKVR